jgi:hypothetical protein
MLLFLYERPVLDLLQTESLSEEVVRTLASAIGLVLAVPVTTAIAALTVGAADQPAGTPSPVVDDRDGTGAHGPSAVAIERAVSGPAPPRTRAEARAGARSRGGRAGG